MMIVNLALLASFLSGQVVQFGIPYSTVDNKPILMDLHVPDIAVARPVPVVVMIHGGAWMAGTRAEMSPLAGELAKHGVAVANIDYRLAPAYKWPAMLDDCRNAVLYIRNHAAQYGLDGSRIGALGGSAGAHLALLLGFTDMPQSGDRTSARVMAVVNLFGPVDLTRDFNKGLASIISTQVLGKEYKDAQAEAKAFSPITYVDAKSAAVYTVQGAEDPMVPVIQSERLDEALKKAGRPHVRVVVEGMGHGVASDDPTVDSNIKIQLEKSLTWLVSRLSRP